MKLKLSDYINEGIEKTIDDALYYHQRSTLDIDLFKENIKRYAILAALEANQDVAKKRIAEIESIQQNQK